MRTADEIEYKLIGDDMQAVVITLDQGETVRAEASAMMYMTAGIEMDTGVEGGLFAGLKRKLTGESFFITNFKCVGTRGQVCFSAPYPGKIVPLDLGQTGEMLCQKDAYLCSAAGIDIDIAFTRKLGAGFFGGEGFILQRLTGNGLAFIHAGGTVAKMNLKPGQSLRVDTGCLVAFQSSVNYDVQFVGGVKTALFGGEGLFFAHLSGQGDVYLQTLPFASLADRIAGASGGTGRGETRRGGSGLLGDLLGGE
jgi:uncharacterized protein (TIGR00266 family)